MEGRLSENLLSNDELERSAVVANRRMNRERGLIGSNGYSVELGFNPLDFLRDRAESGSRADWLDLCRGTGKALIEAGRVIQDGPLAARIEITGVDLVGMFLRPAPPLPGLRLVEASLSTWRPNRNFDLITCVHGLHYVGDKLGLMARAASWLTEDGVFVASLDLHNLKIAGDQRANRRIRSELQRAGLEYGRGRRLIWCRGRRILNLPFRYLGADDQAGPNYTGQPAVNSLYEMINPPEPLEPGIRSTS